MKIERPLLITYIISLLFCLAVLCFSCNPLKHYQKVANDTNRTIEEKKLLAEACTDEFPVKPDTITNVKTDTIIADNSAEMVMLNSIIDSLLIELSKTEKDTALINDLRDRLHEALEEECPPAKFITKTVTNTIIKPDSAKEFLLTQEITYKDGQLNIITAERDRAIKDRNDIKEQQQKSIWYNLKWALYALTHKWWFYLIIAGAVALFYFKINPFSIGKNIISKFKK